MKHTLLIFALLSLVFQNCFSQEIKRIQPTIGDRISYTPAEQKEWSRALQLLIKIEKGDLKDDKNLTAKDKSLIDKLEMMEGPMTLGPGCSWYCGGGPYKILSSSELDTVKYKADNIHDFNLLTGWVEGKSDYGIGEYVEFYFKPNSPRVSTLIIYNGYFKNQDLWESNSRVKKAKLYINDKLYAFLEFQDVNAPHSFSIDPVNSTVENQDLVLKVEIAEVYKGTKYADVVISEINFDGLDVHCFAKGTKIKMADKTTKNIEDLKAGDLVAQIDLKTKQILSAKIKKLENIIHHGLVTYKFENGSEITATRDHPFRIQGKGWASLNPDGSKQYKGFDNPGKITVGDFFMTENGTVKLISIEFLEGDHETFTISKLSSGNNFIANNLIVGIEELKD